MCGLCFASVCVGASPIRSAGLMSCSVFPGLYRFEVMRSEIFRSILHCSRHPTPSIGTPQRRPQQQRALPTRRTRPPQENGRASTRTTTSRASSPASSRASIRAMRTMRRRTTTSRALRSATTAIAKACWTLTVTTRIVSTGFAASAWTWAFAACVVGMYS